MRIIGCIALLGLFATHGARASATRAERRAGVAAPCSAVANAPAAEQTHFIFPRDDGAHDGYATEAWRTFGTLVDRSGGRYDLSVTVSRFAVIACPWPSPQAWTTAWHARHILSVAYQLLDERTGRSERGVRVEREGPNGGSADVRRLRLHVGMLQFERVDDGGRGPRALALRIRDGATTLTVREVALRPPVPLGRSGLVRTGSCADCAAYAYAYPRNAATGTVRTRDTDSVVSGELWFDHEYARRELAASDRGWQRFDIAFDDGRVLDARFVRDARGNVVTSSGTFVAANGSIVYLHDDEIHAGTTPIAPWYSRATSISYPSAWFLGVPMAALGLAVNEIAHDQEIAPVDRSPYVMGPIEVEKYEPPGGDRGHGFVELTGYGAPVSL